MKIKPDQLANNIFSHLFHKAIIYVPAKTIKTSGQARICENYTLSFRDSKIKLWSKVFYDHSIMIYRQCVMSDTPTNIPIILVFELDRNIATIEIDDHHIVSGKSGHKRVFSIEGRVRKIEVNLI